jgi:hypothetical protein
VYIVPVIVILVMSFYYADIHSRCSANRQFRATLNAALGSRAASAEFELREVTGFAWDRVRIVTGFEPESPSEQCPFGWNWAAGERESLIESGLLTVLIFAHRAAIVEYLEIRDDEVAFRGVESSLSPQDAVFGVAPGVGAGGGVILTLRK